MSRKDKDKARNLKTKYRQEQTARLRKTVNLYKENNKEKKSVHCWQCKAVFERITAVESHARTLGHRWREPTQHTIHHVQSVDHSQIASIFHAPTTPRLNSATHPKPATTLSKRNPLSGSGHV